MVLFKTRGDAANSVTGGKSRITSGLNIIYHEVKIRMGYPERESKNIGVCKGPIVQREVRERKLLSQSLLRVLRS